MDEQHKKINKIEELRKKITKLSELIAVGKNARNYFVKRPVTSLFGMLLLGFLTAILSGGIIRLIFGLISFGLRVAAFVFVARQTFNKVSGLFARRKNKNAFG